MMLTAARDLSDYLQRITGKKINIEDHSKLANGRYTIAVGLNDYTRELTDELKDID